MVLLFYSVMRIIGHTSHYFVVHFRLRRQTIKKKDSWTAVRAVTLPRPCKLTISSYLFARWHLCQHVGYLRHQQQVDLWPFDLESGVRRVTCDVGYANFSLPSRPLFSS